MCEQVKMERPGSPEQSRRAEPSKEQFHQRRIAELKRENAKRREQNAKLTEQVAALSKNPSNSSKPPSSDIVKPAKSKNPKDPRRQGGQPGHRGVNRPPFRPDQINRVEELHPPACPDGHDGTLEPVGEPKVPQVAELRENPLEITE